MDEIILTLDQHLKNPSVDITGREGYRIRHAVRAVITDHNGSVPLLHAATRDYYKLPGGGVDAGEDLRTALAREMEEEIGSKADVTQELGQVIEWKDSEQLKQISHCYMASLSGEKGQPDFTEDEIAEGLEVVWAAGINQAIDLVGATADSSDTNVSFMTTRDTAILRAAAQRM
jgi:ADP-ribose pyrophosphatase YjhB (NUDIX family)